MEDHHHPHPRGHGVLVSCRSQVGGLALVDRGSCCKQFLGRLPLLRHLRILRCPVLGLQDLQVRDVVQPGRRLPKHYYYFHIYYIIQLQDHQHDIDQVNLHHKQLILELVGL